MALATDAIAAPGGAMLVDSHCHLDFPDFADELADVVARAHGAGIGQMLTICTKLAKVPANLALVERFERVHLAVGVHPHEADDEGDVTVDRLVEIARHPKVVGIGETGLDYFYTHSTPDHQAASFRTHIRAAKALGLPVIVHTRDAEADTLAILREEAAGAPLAGIIHCFSGTPALAEGALELGMHISFSGIVTFKAAEALRQVVPMVPADRLLVETDSPYLAPVPKRGKRNEPAFVAHTAARVAELRGLPVGELAAQTTRNFYALFSKIPVPAQLSQEAACA